MCKNILIVDDEEAIQLLLEDFLLMKGYNVDSVGDGTAALESLHSKNYDLILSDIHMPKMKGFELLEKVRAEFPGVKRALITAYNVDNYLRLALKHDIGNIIPKTVPFNLNDVERVVENLLTEDFFNLSKEVWISL